MNYDTEGTYIGSGGGGGGSIPCVGPKRPRITRLYYFDGAVTAISDEGRAYVLIKDQWEALPDLPLSPPSGYP
jgi:hypothetical protein